MPEELSMVYGLKGVAQHENRRRLLRVHGAASGCASLMLFLIIVALPVSATVDDSMQQQLSSYL